MFGTNVRKIVTFGALAVLILTSTVCYHKDSHDDIDLESAIWLQAVKEPLRVPKDTVDPGVDVPVSDINPGVDAPIHDLFSYPPGTNKEISAFAGIIDPVGTSLPNDYDGDGILNANESSSNIWVADYPVVETQVATPITMKISILVSKVTTNDEIVSEISSSDFESSRTKGSEKIHQSEMNLKTVQFQDSFSNATELGASTSVGVSYGMQGGFGIASVGMNYGYNASNSWSAKVATAGTVTKWADKPFKNNLDRDAMSLKSDEASRRASKYRSDRVQKIDSTSKVDPNAGYVRAALYIKNHSVNMPVKLRNILCSLMFETPDGTLVPVQSFRLRNDDFSLFEVDVYGGTEFGPYVIELTGLNTAEIEHAIAQGYVPKIYIVDYEMVHVQDSNYRSMLLNYSGNNLKSVEENAKGRTALVKIFGPGIRELYRVAAFDAPGTGDPCFPGKAITVAPGVSLREALKRVSCSGLEIQFEDYVVNLGEAFPTLDFARLHVSGIKSFGGVATTIPCVPVTQTGSDGVARTACVQKPFLQWTDAEKMNAGVWVVYSNGKYYSHSKYKMNGNVPIQFDPTQGHLAAEIVQGLDSIIWAGDHYDIVYLKYADLVANVQSFGNNPLETTKNFQVKTGWDNKSLGANAFDPDKLSQYLGEAGFGERVELKIKLDKTWFLNPQFKNPMQTGFSSVITDFNYAYGWSTNRFDLLEALDFEISLGLGGERSDWLHVLKDIDAFDPTRLQNCGRSLDYVNQTFNICVQLPTQHPIVSAGTGLFRLYLRPALNSAYRQTVWPLRFQDVRKFQGTLDLTAPLNSPSIIVRPTLGNLPVVGESLYFANEPSPYTVLSISGPVNGAYTIGLGSNTTREFPKQHGVYVKAALTEPDIKFVRDNTFVADWNTEHPAVPSPTLWNSTQKLPLVDGTYIDCAGTEMMHPRSCLGNIFDANAVNWMGAYNYGVPRWNSWSDGGNYLNFLNSGLPFIGNQSHSTSMRIEPWRADFMVNSTPSIIPITSPQTVIYGQKALTIWRQGTQIWGREIDITANASIGVDDFLISHAPGVVSEPVLVMDGSSAAIVWVGRTSSAPITDAIFARVFNFVTDSLGAAPVQVNSGAIIPPTTLWQGNLYPTKVSASASGGRLVVVFNH